MNQQPELDHANEVVLVERLPNGTLVEPGLAELAKAPAGTQYKDAYAVQRARQLSTLPEPPKVEEVK